MATEKRLIDANALSEAVSGIGKDIKRPRAVELACLVMINEAPTVDAVEVVHGRMEWIPTDDFELILTCSVCKKTDGASIFNKFCPNCGAKMDGDGND